MPACSTRARRITSACGTGRARPRLPATRSMPRSRCVAATAVSYCRLHAAAIDRDNPREGTVWIVEDLEEQTRIRDELWNAQRDLEATFAAANVGIVLIRGRRIVRANPVSRRCSAIARTAARPLGAPLLYLGCGFGPPARSTR